MVREHEQSDLALEFSCMVIMPEKNDSDSLFDKLTALNLTNS